MPAIDADRPPGEALRSLARKSLLALAKELAAAAEGSGVHGARKRIKFARSLLHLIRHGLGGHDFGIANRRLGEAADALAGARRAEALQEAVAKLAPGIALSELAAIAAGVHREIATPEALRAAAATALRQVEEVRANVARWALPKRDITLYLKAMAEDYARARGKLLEGIASAHVATLHKGRRSVIHHLHQLEILRPLWPGMIKLWVAELLTLRESLGDLNDLEELEALLKEHAGAFSSDATRAEASETIATRRNDLLKQVRKQIDHLFAEKPGAFAKRIGAMWQRLLD